ncbi:MAG: hypothetical protein WC227_03970 [Patescibacteria group bacterium]
MIFYIILLVLLSLVLFLTMFWQISLLWAAITGVPIVYSWKGAVLDSLKLAGLKSGETIIDLGSGDCQTLILAAKKFGAKGIGVDRSIWCYLKAKLNVWMAGESKNIRIIRGDFKDVEKELKAADVVYVYLLDQVLAQIEKWLFDSIGEKTRVVSLSFLFKVRKPVAEANTRNLYQDTKARLYRK